MINPFDYLYYKMYKISLYIGSEGVTAGWMGIFLFLNLFTIYGWLTGNRDPATKHIGIICFFTITLTYMVYWIFKRDKKVIAKFKNESTKSREVGNLVVICYVILTIVSFILVIK